MDYMMSVITVHISNAPCIFGNYSQDCLECKQTFEQKTVKWGKL